MSLKPKMIATAAGGFTLAFLAQDVVAACERASNDSANQCGNIPAAVEYLTVVSSAPSVSPPEVMADVKDGRTGIIYKVTVPGHENLD